MLKLMCEIELTDAERLAALFRSCCAIDTETGAYLIRGYGLHKGGHLPRYVLIVPEETPQERGGLFAGKNYLYRYRAFIRAMNDEAAVHQANKVLTRWQVLGGI